MPETSGPWARLAEGATAVGDQSREGFGEDNWRRMFRRLGDGVLPESGETGGPLEVYATGNDRLARVRPGRAIVDGLLYQGLRTGGQDYVSTLQVPTTTEAAGAGVPWWRVVVRVNPTAKTARLYLRSSANARILTQDPDGTWDLPLGTFPAFTGSLTNDMIQDDRRFQGDVVRAYRSLVYPAEGITPATIADGTRATVGGWGYASGDPGTTRDKYADGIDYANGVFTVKSDGLYEGFLQLAFSGGSGGGTREVAYMQGQTLLSRGISQVAATGNTITATAVMPPKLFAAGTQVAITALTTGASSSVQLSSLNGANLATLRRVGSPR